jgi:DNA mismatch repair protein MutL
LHFTLKHNERIVHDLPATDNWRERIATCFGHEIGSELLWVESQDGEAAVRGYVANPSQSRANNRLQFLFLNGRFIRDRSLQHALGEAYRGLLLTGRFPIAFLHLVLPADAVDVNVHPTKLEVRFEDGGRIYSQLLSTLRTKFLTSDLTARVSQPMPIPPASVNLEPRAIEEHRRELANWARGDIGPTQGAFELKQQTSEPLQAKFDFRPQPAWRPIPEFIPFDAGQPRAPFGGPSSDERVPTGTGASPVLPPSDSDSSQPEPAPSTAAFRSSTGLQIQNRYIVTETDEGMVVIDQHALHERILYEQIRGRVLGGKLETQRLLVPEPVSLTPAEAAAALESKEALAQLGIEIEQFGGDTILISSYPAMLANLSPNEVLRTAVELLLAGGKKPERRDVVDELLHMISCKAAIKAGDRLSAAEVDALLEQRHLFQDTHHCPHGRPTALVFTREELDRRFKRT